MLRPVKRLALAYYRLRGYYPTTISDSQFQCDASHAGFWRHATKGRFEPYTYRFLSSLLTPDSVYCDVGAWIGPTVIYAARRCKQVYCFEPDVFAYEYLLSNIRLNHLHNVIPFNIALSDSDGMVQMASFGGTPGDCQTSLIKEGAQESGLNALAMSWETWCRIANPDRIDFLKIDIEGAEFDLVPTLMEYLRQHKPILHLSTHAPYLPEPERDQALARLRDLGNIYTQCFNEELERVDMEELTSEFAKTTFTSFLFVAGEDEAKAGKLFSA